MVASGKVTHTHIFDPMALLFRNCSQNGLALREFLAEILLGKRDSLILTTVFMRQYRVW